MMGSSSLLLQVLGSTLLHFLWQGMLIAAALAAALVLTRQQPAYIRYRIRYSAIIAMGVAFVLTFGILAQQAPQVLANPMVTARVDEPRFPWLISAWLCGVLIQAIRLVHGLMQVRKLRQLSTSDIPGPLLRRFRHLARQLGTHAELLVVDTSRILVPLTIGWIRPVVLLPAQVLSGLPQSQIEALLAHELAHVYRRDYVANLLQSTLELLLFYHPAVWWVSRGIRREREYCCDDLAITCTREPLIYARALTELEEFRGPALQLAPSSAGGSLMSRIQRVITAVPHSPMPSRSRVLSGAAVLGVVAMLGGTAAAMATALPDDAWHEGHHKIEVRIQDENGHEHIVVIEPHSTDSPDAPSTTAQGVRLQQLHQRLERHFHAEPESELEFQEAQDPAAHELHRAYVEALHEQSREPMEALRELGEKLAPEHRKMLHEHLMELFHRHQRLLAAQHATNEFFSDPSLRTAADDDPFAEKVRQFPHKIVEKFHESEDQRFPNIQKPHSPTVEHFFDHLHRRESQPPHEQHSDNEQSFDSQNEFRFPDMEKPSLRETLKNSFEQDHLQQHLESLHQREAHHPQPQLRTPASDTQFTEEHKHNILLRLREQQKHNTEMGDLLRHHLELLRQHEANQANQPPGAEANNSQFPGYTENHPRSLLRAKAKKTEPSSMTKKKSSTAL